MNDIEDLKTDHENSKVHSVFADVDDEILGRRCQGYFMKDVNVDKEGNTVYSVVFDNGHHYLTNGIDAKRADDIPAKVFIHKYLEKVLYAYVRLAPFPVSKDVHCSQYEVSVTSFIRLVIDRDDCIVKVTNILVPIGFHHHNYGKDLLALIYHHCKQLGYRLWFVDMVQSFYDRMVKRGAKVIEVNDIVEIDDGTDLSKH